MSEAAASLSTPARALRPLNQRQRRQMLEQAADRLLAAVEGILADLDALDGDADLEPSLGFSDPPWPTDQTRIAEGARDDREIECEDEGAQCEDEGFDSDREPDVDHIVPLYADDGHDQTRIVTAMFVSRQQAVGVR